MNRSMHGVRFALGIPLVLALSASPASADQAARPKQARGCGHIERRLAACEQWKAAQSSHQTKGRAQTPQRMRPGYAPAVAQDDSPQGDVQTRPAECPPPCPPCPACPPEPRTEQGRQPDQQMPEWQPQPYPQWQSVPPRRTELAVNERRLCEDIAQKATLQVEDIDRGVAVVLIPKPGYRLSDLRRSIDALEFALEEHKGKPRPAPSERCSLVDLYRRTGDLPKVMEGGNIMALHFTVEQPGKVSLLRQDAYRFVCVPADSSAIPGQVERTGGDSRR